jgi:hypothetical protein
MDRLPVARAGMAINRQILLQYQAQLRGILGINRATLRPKLRALRRVVDKVLVEEGSAEGEPGQAEGE